MIIRISYIQKRQHSLSARIPHFRSVEERNLKNEKVESSGQARNSRSKGIHVCKVEMVPPVAGFSTRLDVFYFPEFSWDAG